VVVLGPLLELLLALPLLVLQPLLEALWVVSHH
jgi:hypothetical protein